MKNKNPGHTDLTSISDTEKAQLKSRILSSVNAYAGRKKRLKYVLGMAASMALLFGLGRYFHQKKTESITDFVKTTKNIEIKNSDKVTLILNEGENVDIDEDNPTITYSASGEKVNVGADRSLHQENRVNDDIVYNTLIVPYGKRSDIKLSDGSTVWINSGSKLIYPAVFKGAEREVYLEGEAIFEVVHDESQPFIVHSEKQEIEVLGTVFNVNNYADENSAFTVLKSGSVKIRYAKDLSEKPTKNLLISPGTMASYNKKTTSMASKKVDVNRYFSWREGALIFKNDDLETIMRKLSRYYNIEISIENERLAVETFSGYLDLKEDIEKVMATLGETTELEYNRIGKRKMTITAKN